MNVVSSATSAAVAGPLFVTVKVATTGSPISAGLLATDTVTATSAARIGW